MYKLVDRGGMDIMVDTDLIENLYYSFILIRSHIEEESNSTILMCFSHAMKENLSNVEFLNYFVHFIDNKFISENMIRESEKNIILEHKRQEILCLIMNIAFLNIIDMLKSQKYENAYNLVDAFHALPKVFMKKKISLGKYYMTYIKPIEEHFTQAQIKVLKRLFKVNGIVLSILVCLK